MTLISGSLLLRTHVQIHDLGATMLHLLEAIPVLGPFVVGPALDLVHFTVDTVQFLVGI
jgi:hypothetical protein